MSEDGELIAPYAKWAILTDFAHLKGEWFRVLLELNEPASAFAARIEKPFFMEHLRIPYIYQSPPREFKADDLTFCMANMTRKTLRALVTCVGTDEFVTRLMPLRPMIKRLELGTTEPSPLKKSRFRIAAPLAPKSPETGVVAIIDDGLAFANERFRFANGTTRFEY